MQYVLLQIQKHVTSHRWQFDLLNIGRCHSMNFNISTPCVYKAHIQCESFKNVFHAKKKQHKNNLILMFLSCSCTSFLSCLKYHNKCNIKNDQYLQCITFDNSNCDGKYVNKSLPRDSRNHQLPMTIWP